jgi:hypothetical protein
MYASKKNHLCSGFKALDYGTGYSYRRISSGNCKDCVYFSSRNCGMDVADSIEPNIEALF